MAEIAIGAAVAIKTVIGGTLAGLGVGATTAYGIGSAVGTFVTSTGFLLAVAGSVAGALSPQVDAAGSPTEWKADPDAGIPFIVGRRGVAGNIVHRDEWGSDDRYQSIVTVYSGAGPINAFGTFTADGVTCTFAGSYGRQSTGTWNDIFWRDTKLGAQPETALETPADKSDPTIAGTMPAWNSSYKLSGKAASMLTMAMDKDRERWPNGEPQPLQVIEGILCWDPRLDSTYPGGSGSCRVDDASTWVYSENPYLHALKWCLGYFENGVLVGGIGAAQSGIDVPAFVEGANIADANGWLISGQPTTKDDKHQVLLAMLQAGGGVYMRKGGKISCMVRTPRSSIVTVSAADTAGPFEIEIGADRLTRRNTIIPRCVMETHDWEMVAQDPVAEASYVTADGGTRESGVDYPYVAIKSNGTNRHQPAQLAAYAMVDSRETIRGTVPFKPHMAQVEPGDVFTIDEPGFLLDGVECLCMSRVFEPATNIVRIGFVSETSGKHTYALGLDPTPPTPPGLTAPDIYTVAAPGAGVWTATADTGNVPGITVTGEADLESITGIVVEYRTELDPDDDQVWDDDDSGWQVVGEFKPSTSTIPITGLESSTGYQVAISYISQFGVVGDRRISAVITTGAMVADDAVAVGGVPSADLLADLADAEQDILDNIEDIGDAFDEIDTLTADLAQEALDRAAAVEAERAQTTRDIGALSQEVGAEVAALLALAQSESDRRLSEDARVEELVIGVGARLDGDEFYSAASVDQTFLAIADFDSTIGLYDLTVHSDFAALVGDLDDLSDDVDALGVTVDDLPNVYLSQSDASSTYATQNSQTVALATLQDDVEAQIDIVEGDLDDLGDVVDTINAQVSSTSTALATLTRSFGEATQNIAAQIAGALSAIAVGSAAVADVESAAFAHTENYRAEFTAQLDETVDGTLAHSIADVASYAVGQSDIDSSFAAWGLAVSSEYDITTRFGDAESDISDLSDDLDTLDGELDTLTSSVASIASDYITSTGQTSAFAGFGMTIGSEYNVTTRFGDVESDVSDLVDDVSALDGDLDTLTTSVADIAADYITSTGQTSAFAQFGLTLGAGFNIDTRFGDAEADIDTLTDDLVDANAAIDVNALAIAAADRAVAEMSQSIGAWLAGALASSESSTRAAVTQSEAVLQRLETLRVTLEADYLNSSAIEAAYLLQADFDSTLAAYTFSVNSVTRTIADHLNHVEDGVDALGVDLDTNYYTIAEADAEFMTSTEVDSAIASYNLSVHSSITPITGDIDDILADIDGVAGVSTGLNAIASLMLDAFVDNSDPDNPLLLARVQLEAAAGGGNPAFLSLLDGAGLNSAVLAADVVVLANLGAGEDEIQEALRAVDGNIEIVNDLLLGAAGSMRQYDDSDVLRLLFGEDDSGDRGIFAYDANGDDLLIIDIDNEIYEIAPAMLPSGSTISESSGYLAETSIWANSCSSGACTPTDSSDYVTIYVETDGLVNGPPGAKVRAEFSGTIVANADIFTWLYFTNTVQLGKSNSVAFYNIGDVVDDRHSAAQSVSSASAQMVSANYGVPHTVHIVQEETLPPIGNAAYDAAGYKGRYRWKIDTSFYTPGAEGVNRNGPQRDCVIFGVLKVEVINP